MKTISIGVFAFLAIGIFAQCQPNDSYVLSTETIKKKPKESIRILANQRYKIIGYKNGLLSYSIFDSLGRVRVFTYDEKTLTIKEDKINVDQSLNKIIRLQRSDSLIGALGYFNLSDFPNVPVSEVPIDNHEYQDLWLKLQGSQIKLDSLPFHFIDKFYDIKFSFDNRFLICNLYDPDKPGYEKEQDGFIYFYDLQDLKNVDRTALRCDQCSRSFFNNDTWIFQVERPIGNGFDGSYHNIWLAQNTFTDTTIIAKDISIKTVSPDMQYILGSRYLFGRPTPVIINVKDKKFEYILGRNYPLDKSFYSIVEKKFAFDVGSEIIYIDLPKKFPFDATTEVTKFTTKQENENFWAKYPNR